MKNFCWDNFKLEIFNVLISISSKFHLVSNILLHLRKSKLFSFDLTDHSVYHHHVLSAMGLCSRRSDRCVNYLHLHWTSQSRLLSRYIMSSRFCSISSNYHSSFHFITIFTSLGPSNPTSPHLSFSIITCFKHFYICKSLF